ncbi:suppressor protein SRP40 [Spatholobus suberectus]|nr:suppressor protein SRP40 [Spatholobus suberectus]
MEPKTESEPIPTGWTLETEVLSDGSKAPFYYCPYTGQHFYSYSDLMRYVDYAKKAKLGIYAPGMKSLQKKSTENDTPVPQPRKTSSTLSLPKNSIYYRSDDESSDYSDSSLSSERTADKMKDPDYALESEGSVSVDSESSDAKSEVTQVLKEEKNDLGK